MEIDQFVLDNVFDKIETEYGPVYWRSCILRAEDMNGEQGYMVIYQDGTYHHTYHFPPDFIET